MSNHRFIRKVHLVLIAVISTIVISSPSISNHGYFDITKAVYGQLVPDLIDSNTTSSVNMQDIPLKKVRVGDIDVAYKMFGQGDPIILYNGASDSMDAWDPSFLTGISSNHTVIARSEEHTSELQSRETISYAVFCLKKKITTPFQDIDTRHKPEPRSNERGSPR